MTAAAKFQSFNWMRGVCGDHMISVVHRLILVRLCIHRQSDGRCNPGFDTLANDVGVHRATVFRAVEAAIRRGWIAPNPSHGGRLPQNFVLTFPADKPSQPRDGSEHPTVAPVRLLEPPTVAAVQRNRRTSATQPSQRQRASREKPKASTRPGHLVGQRERAVESDSRPPVAARDQKRSPAKKTPAARPQPKSELGDSFERFWAVYPKRVAKEAARKAHAAAIKRGADPDTLIATAQRYAVERAGQEPRYTKHPATWLNGGCWEDEAPPAGAVIDEAGNLVAYEQPQQQQSAGRGFASIAEELIAAHVIDPKTGW